jgi:hypothetical protein
MDIMFWKKFLIGPDSKKDEPQNTTYATITLEALKAILTNMDDAEIIERQTNQDQKVIILYIRTLIDQERLSEAIIEPLSRCSKNSVYECMPTKVLKMTTINEAQTELLSGSVLIFDPVQNLWLAVPLENPLSRSIETSETETVIYGAKDSFSEQLEQNITMIRRRLPVTTLKSERFTVGSLSKTKIVLMYMEGITNPEFISIAKSKISNIDFDHFHDSSQVAVFMEDHNNTIFPQFQETDRPDACSFSLGQGKIVFLVSNTPYALIGPITFFDLFQSPEDYFLRWPVASFFRCIRFLSFFLSIALIPLYVALSTHHYQMVPLQILFVLLESRSKLPFTPFWEALPMVITLEIIKEASLRMPTKTSQTLGVIGGIVIGQAAVQAGFASKVLIVLIGISAIASFLVPNYLMTKTSTLIQIVFLILSTVLGIPGIVIGMIAVLAHLNGLSSLKQPYFAPVAPLYIRDWLDLFIRGNIKWMKTRPDSLRTLQKWRYSRRR